MTETSKMYRDIIASNMEMLDKTETLSSSIKKNIEALSANESAQTEATPETYNGVTLKNAASLIENNSKIVTYAASAILPDKALDALDTVGGLQTVESLLSSGIISEAVSYITPETEEETVYTQEEVSAEPQQEAKVAPEPDITEEPKTSSIISKSAESKALSGKNKVTEGKDQEQQGKDSSREVSEVEATTIPPNTVKQQPAPIINIPTLREPEIIEKYIYVDRYIKKKSEEYIVIME